MSTLAERVVEDEDARVAEDGASEGGALLLAAGKREPAFADRGFEAIREILEFLANMRGLAACVTAAGAAPGTPKAMFS